jgi:hypothetical protein
MPQALREGEKHCFRLPEKKERRLRQAKKEITLRNREKDREKKTN